MNEQKNNGCVSIIAILICLIISGTVVSPFITNIGFLAYPLIVGGGFGLAKLTEPIWFKNKN